MHNPTNDGIDHINVYSQGKTELGRFLSNFAHTPINLTDDGHFESVEGYWYWLSSHDDSLRSLYGFKAKQHGKLCKRIFTLSEEEFRKKIKKAIAIKICQNPIMSIFEHSILPFDHYYVFDNIPKDAGFKWIIEYLEYARNKLKQKSIEEAHKRIQ